MCPYQPYCRHSNGRANSEPFRRTAYSVCAAFTVLYPQSLQPLSDTDMELAANELQQTYSSDLGQSLVTEVRSFRREFSKELEKTKKNCIWHTEIHNELSQHVICPRIGYHVTRAYCLSLSQLAVASAERSFSKLKNIKTHLRSTISQDRLDGLALECAKWMCKTIEYGRVDRHISEQ